MHLIRMYILLLVGVFPRCSRSSWFMDLVFFFLFDTVLLYY